jgi:asparagine synthetase B (glutamine-hydrolysing)
MSSILGFSGHSNSNKSVWTKDKILKLAGKFQNEGDYQDFYEHQDDSGLLYLVHNRLVTVGLETTTFMGKDNLVVAFDGEIINYQKFDDLFKKTGSVFDSDTNYEFLLYVYRNLVRVSEEHSVPDEFKYDLNDKGISSEELVFVKLMELVANGNKTLFEAFTHILNIIRGDFTFVLHDVNRKKSWMIRKGYGLTPLYYGITQYGEFMIASEKKVLIDDCAMIFPFTVNSFVYGQIIGNIPTIIPIIPYLPWIEDSTYETKYNAEIFRRSVFDQFNNLEKFIKTSIQVNKLPFALLFDGSLESQLTLKTMNRVMKTESKWGAYPHVFSINLEENTFPDSIKTFLSESGIIHYSFKYTIQNVLPVVSKIIYIMETNDMDTILSAIPLYLLLDKIQKCFHLKYLYSSMGLDEFRFYVDRSTLKTKFQAYSEKYSALGNKLPSAFGIQLNVPFIEAGLVANSYNFDNEFWNNNYKGEIEDFHLMREMSRQFSIMDKDGENAFRNEKSTLKNSLEKEVMGLVTDQEFGTGLLLFQNNPPRSKLDYYFKKIYMEYFGNK